MSDYSYVFRRSGNDVDLLLEYGQEDLTHTTSKDFLSFYLNFSENSYFDTGLLPVAGSGVLSIRSAGNHSQVVYQHAPAKNYINVGESEGDQDAFTYYVAQPYRIVLIDFVENSLYGARVFYSPYPITHLGAQLYHTNLPNINCKGYGPRKRLGVGWVCLYHQEFSSNINSFSDLLRIALERTSGMETYNYANMSETDGINFYAAHYKNSEKYGFLFSPLQWEKKTEKEGIDWILDEDLLVPILVAGIDDQGAHDPDGVPLTLGMAMLGEYDSYYSDPEPLKLINRIVRYPFDNSMITSLSIFNYFHTSLAKTDVAHNTNYNSYAQSSPEVYQKFFNSEFKESSLEDTSTNSSPPFSSIIFEGETSPSGGHDIDDEEGHYTFCDHCETKIYLEQEEYTYTDNDFTLCSSCSSSNLHYIESTSSNLYIPDATDSAYIEYLGLMYDDEYDDFIDPQYSEIIQSHRYYCSFCNEIHNLANTEMINSYFFPYPMIRQIAQANGHDVEYYSNLLGASVFSKKFSQEDIDHYYTNTYSMYSYTFRIYPYNYNHMIVSWPYLEELYENYTPNYSNYIKSNFFFCEKFADSIKNSEDTDSPQLTLYTPPMSDFSKSSIKKYDYPVGYENCSCSSCSNLQAPVPNSSEDSIQISDINMFNDFFKLLFPKSEVLHNQSSFAYAAYRQFSGYCLRCKSLAFTKAYTLFLASLEDSEIYQNNFFQMPSFSIYQYLTNFYSSTSYTNNYDPIQNIETLYLPQYITQMDSSALSLS